MSVTLICQLEGPFQCWHTATWKTEWSLWWIKRDRWVRLEQRSNTIMFLRYEYKTTQLTGHTRFYFISQCTRPPYFVFFVLFSSDYLHLILTAVRHLEHFRFKMQVSILDLSLKCKTPAITNMAWVSTYPHRQRHTHCIHTHTHTYSRCVCLSPIWSSYSWEQAEFQLWWILCSRSTPDIRLLSIPESNVSVSDHRVGHKGYEPM